MLVMVLSFVILADFNIENLGDIASNIYLLAVILYLIVFVNGFIEILQGFQKKSVQLLEFAAKQERNQKEYIMIRSNRKNLNIEIDKLAVIESLADYVKIHSDTETYVTKQRISELAKILPERFVRIHRSFIINADKIDSFNREHVLVGGQEYSFGRKYKEEASDFLNTRATA